MYPKAARPRLAQAWLQYFLALPYSRLARNGLPHSGQIAVQVDFHFSGCGFLFFQAYLQDSEQNILERPPSCGLLPVRIPHGQFLFYPGFS